MDKWGRKAGVFYCSFFSLLGGGLLCGSRNIAMFIAARFIAGWGSWGFLAVTPTYCAELAPPGLRGFFVGMNGVNIALGYALASYMGMAFFFADDDAAKWRGPLGLALIWPLMMIAIMFIVPESPRFLLMKGEVEKARDIVYRLHKTKGDLDQEFARGEFYQMQKQTEWVCCSGQLHRIEEITDCRAGQNLGSRMVGNVHQEGLQEENCACYGLRLCRPVDWCTSHQYVDRSAVNIGCRH